MDFLAIGDVVIDNFIRLKDAKVHCNINAEDCEICMRWGDKIPFEFNIEVPAVGNAANAAVAAARLGLTSALRAYVGADEYGKKCLDSLRQDGVDTSLVVEQQGKHTNYHFVLWYEAERTILIKHEQFDYAFADLPQPPKWLYLSSLAQNSLGYEQACEQWLEKHPETKFAFQPGTFQIAQGPDTLAALYARADIFFCNKEEAARILKRTAGTDIKELLKGLQMLGPKTAVITDDVRGAYAAEEGGRNWFVPRYPDPRAPYEITGAGDAFGSTTVAALCLGQPLGEALRWGAVNASSVLQEVGAQKGLLTRTQLEQNLANPPAPFGVAPL